MLPDGQAAVHRALALHRAIEREPPVGVDLPVRAVDGPLHPLPAPRLPPVTLAAALADRRSRYDFSGAPPTVDDVSALLHGAFGPTARVAAFGDPGHPLPASPTAGGLGSVTVHLVTTAVPGIAPGVQRYVPTGHALAPVPGADPGALAGAYLQRPFAERAPATLVLGVDLVRPVARYGARHYRVLHVDAGIAAQSLYLVATALGLSCCAVSGFREDACRRLVAMPEHELPVLLFPFGPGRGAATAG